MSEQTISAPEQQNTAIHLSISKNASPSLEYFLLIVLAAIIATLGLLTNSSAVVIGAMLVAPLLGPILGIGLATVTDEWDLLRRSASALVFGSGLAIAVATAITLANSFLPVADVSILPGEVLARTQPSLLDFWIALAGGLAVAYATTRPNLSAVVSGAAIATALMPPLATMGIGLALARMDVIEGAGLLFLVNALTITVAASITLRLRGFHKNRYSILLSGASVAALIFLVPWVRFGW